MRWPRARKALKAAFLEKPDPAKALDRQRVLVDEVLKTIWARNRPNRMNWL